jgi:hypothetical protein
MILMSKGALIGLSCTHEHLWNGMGIYSKWDGCCAFADLVKQVSNTYPHWEQPPQVPAPTRY